MSVRMALAKLCACTCGGAIIGGGAVHVAENPPQRPAFVKSAKMVKQAPRRYARVKPVKRYKRVRTACVVKTRARPRRPGRSAIRAGPCPFPRFRPCRPWPGAAAAE